MRQRIEQRLARARGTPLVMGVLNVTDDSFSDGGEFLDTGAAVGRAREMIDEGADLIDVGPESTRPGAAEIDAEVQIERAVPVIRAIRDADDAIPVSIDTRLAAVAKQALADGADMINDVSALRDDPAMVETVVSSGAWVCLMHRRGTASSMQRDGGPQYADVVAEVLDFLRERVERAVDGGVERSRIVIDPGIGFGKRVEHNLLILKELDRFVALGQPLLVGASRKSFIGAVLGIEDPKHREPASLACAAIATFAGAAMIRTHNVHETVEVVRLCAAVRNADGGR